MNGSCDRAFEEALPASALILGRREAVRLGAVALASVAFSLSGCALSESEDASESHEAETSPTDNTGQSGANKPASGFDQGAQGMPFPSTWVCVSEYAGNTVAVIDAEQGEIVQRISAGLNPSMMVSTATAVYVGGSGDGSIYAIDVATGSVTTIPAGNQPLGMCLDESAQRLYVADYFDSSIRTVDTVLGSVVGSVRLSAVGYLNRTDPPECCVLTTGTGRRPVSVAVVPEEGILYAADFGTYDVARVDLAGGVELEPFDGVVGPRTVAVSHDGTMLLLAGVGGEEEKKVSDLYLVDRQSGDRVREIPIGVGVADACQSSDGTRVYAIARDEGVCVVLDSATWEECARVSLSPGIEMMCLSSDDRFLYIANAETGILSAIDTATLVVSFEVSGLANPKDVCSG